VNVWNINPSFGGCEIESVEKLREREAKGQQFWIYASNTSGQPAIGNNEIDCEAVGTLTWMWVPWKHRVAGAMIWEAFFASFGPARAETLWTSPLPHTGIPNDIGYPNGDVSCLFPWEFISAKPCAIPGIQLKLLRRGSQDVEYLHLLSQLKGNRTAADSLCAALLGPCLWDLPCDLPKGDGWRKHREGTLFPDDPGYTYMHGKWSHNPEDWVRARYAAFEAIEKSPSK
jgi:hypothetical protein